MKKVALPLARLSFSQKLDLMETLWTDLASDEEKLDSPAWHGDVLKERGAAYAAGKLTASDWDQAKKRIKKKVS
jgi:putative addiction module component (TIGR02574 family)